jgi:hypothetical protein
VPLYLRRLLLAGDQDGIRVFRSWYRARRELLDDMVAAGVARPSRDRAVRSAFLVINDLAVLLLRDQLIHVLGVDPLSPEGMSRWAGQARRLPRRAARGRHGVSFAALSQVSRERCRTTSGPGAGGAEPPEPDAGRGQYSMVFSRQSRSLPSP